MELNNTWKAYQVYKYRVWQWKQLTLEFLGHSTETDEAKDTENNVTSSVKGLRIIVHKCLQNKAIVFHSCFLFVKNKVTEKEVEREREREYTTDCCTGNS